MPTRLLGYLSIILLCSCGYQGQRWIDVSSRCFVDSDKIKLRKDVALLDKDEMNNSKEFCKLCKRETVQYRNYCKKL